MLSKNELFERASYLAETFTPQGTDMVFAVLDDADKDDPDSVVLVPAVYLDGWTSRYTKIEELQSEDVKFYSQIDLPDSSFDKFHKKYIKALD